MSLEPAPCLECGACCVAPDISTLAKPLGVPCPSLGQDLRCTRYATRPPVCRGYRPDELCLELAALPTLEARVARYLQVFGLDSEGAGA